MKRGADIRPSLYVAESVIQPVKSGVVTGARSKKTRKDFPEIELLSEEDVRQAIAAGVISEPARKKPTEMEVLNEIGEKRVQEMLMERSSSKIAEELGIAFQIVCRYIKKHDLFNPHSNENRKIDVSKMPLDEIERKLDSGQSMTSIGKELGYTQAWMRKAVEEIKRRKDHLE